MKKIAVTWDRIWRSLILSGGQFLVSATTARDAAAHNEDFYRGLRLSKQAVEADLKSRCARLGLRYDPVRQSVHYAAFCAVAKSGFAPRRILELGTDRAEATLLLADLFPGAQIVTVDLPANDPLMLKFTKAADYEEIVAQRLARPNITRVRVNTAFLWSLKQAPFDLIWCDAGHHYPEVAWDHFYCLSKLAPGGWLFSDDIRMPGNILHTWKPEALHAYEVVEYLKARYPMQSGYLLKREDPLLYLVDRKHVAFFHLPDSPVSST